MIKVEIELDEKKIMQDNKYLPESIMNTLDDVFAKKNQPILEADSFRRVHRDSGNPEKDFAVLGNLILNLAEKDWFLPYAKKILWYNSEDGNNENDFNVEDFLKTIISNHIGVSYVCRN